MSMNQTGDHRFYMWDPFSYLGHWLLEPLRGTEAYRLQIALTVGRPLADAPALDLAIAKNGQPMDFSYAGLGMAVVSPRAADLLHRAAAADVQLIPCRINGVDDGFQVVNIITRLDCVDRARSNVIIPADPEGVLTEMVAWVIDPDRAAGHALFRLDNEKITIVVSEELKKAIIREGMVGPGLIELDGEGLRNLMPGYKPMQMKRETGRKRRRT